MPEAKFRFLVQISVRKVEKGFFADESWGQHNQNMVRREAIPMKHSSRLRAYPDFCLRRTFILDSRFEVCQFVLIDL
jgi:hypothetical protein